MGALAEGRLESTPRLEEELAQAQAAQQAAEADVTRAADARAAADVEAAAAAGALAAVEALEKEDREAERTELARRAEREGAAERKAASDRELAEIMEVEETAPPLRALAGALEEREARQRNHESEEQEHRRRLEEARAAKARAEASADKVADLERQAAGNEMVLGRAEEVEEGLKQLEAASKALEKAVVAHTNAAQAKRQLKTAQARLDKAVVLIGRGARAEEESNALAPVIEAAGQARAALPGLEARRGAVQEAAGGARSELERLEAELTEFSSLKATARCPKCKQEISREHLEGHREELEQSTQEAKRRLAKAQAEGRTLDREWAAAVRRRDAGAEALRTKAALDQEAAHARAAAEEARELKRQIEEAKELAGAGETAEADRERLDREVREKKLYERLAGEIEAAKKLEADLGKRLKAAKAEHEEAAAHEREIELDLTAHPFDASKGEAVRREAREAREAAVRLRAVEEVAAKRPAAVENAKRAAEALAAIDGALSKASAARAGVGRRLAEARPHEVRDRSRAADAARGAAAAQAGAAALRVEDAKGRVARAAAELQGLAAERVKLDRLRHTRDFVEQCFTPGMEEVEVQVLSDLNVQFNARFRDYFARLMEGASVDVEIDEDFTPEVMQGAEPLPVQALSGGERTSIALAYRLALNMLVSRAAGMETPDLLVLDEPTDGFSKEQLARVGELIRDLDCQQVILVSHERELEACADHVFEVVKDGTVSRVVAR
jgi:exonuclease SbcC